ncbi:hypothetical protein [Pseudovibrio sp. POLY-S9]|uniref:hypothetical protein n=1 Tax=Pseudovibrio sp. POLY-S9 TaxID=1576596 RepID=UPI00070F8E5B|nr:hypothetical protein [Pseudovibrio sp. POLY-S9]
MREMLRIIDTACEAEVGGKLVKGQLFSIGDEVMLVAGTGAKLNGIVRDLKKNGRAVRVEVEAFGRTTKATVPVDKVALS